MGENGGEIVLSLIQPEEISAVARIISLALVNTPNSIAMWGGNTEAHRRRLEQAIRVVNLENPHYHTLVAYCGGELSGALCWSLSPDCQLTFLEALKLTPKMLRIVQGATLRAFRLQLIGARVDPKKPHIHLGPIGVLPECQGKGVGKKLVRRALEIHAPDKMASYLETDQIIIVASYQREGFQVIDEVDFLGIHNWLMWREP